MGRENLHFLPFLQLQVPILSQLIVLWLAPRVSLGNHGGRTGSLPGFQSRYVFVLPGGVFDSCTQSRELMSWKKGCWQRAAEAVSAAILGISDWLH
mmetsp:Transcript_64977/g.152910  ORF Transcript_64977/g.152910 Transcript_64977/m.152910 type:complete len:96 (-) Transcript_64977:1143-1430(-)